MRSALPVGGGARNKRALAGLPEPVLPTVGARIERNEKISASECVPLHPMEHGLQLAPWSGECPGWQSLPTVGVWIEMDVGLP